MAKSISNSAAEATLSAASAASPTTPSEVVLGAASAVPPMAPQAAATLDPAQISGVGDFTTGEPTRYQGQTYLTPSGKVFLVQNATTVEVRTDPALVHLLVDKYESVMVSRYFGQSGVEIVLSGQLSPSEVDDLIRLSYNLSNTI